VYDYYLGGSHNFAPDREMAKKAMEMWPELPLLLQENRAFLRRAVNLLLDLGIRQFLDLGSGIPTAGNVHEVVHARDPYARVVYVDMDPVAVLHSRAILAGNPHTGVVQADLRNPQDILKHPDVTRLIDTAEPVAVLMVAVLHFIDDSDDPLGILADYRDAVSRGSYLAISHASMEGHDEKAAEHQHLYRRTATPMTMRSRAQIEELFGGWSLMEPGVALIPTWRPEADSLPDRLDIFAGYAGLARKP
jgi:hypothetical protein